MAKLNAKQLKKAHSDLQDDARQRIAERGILQFRADPETVLAVMSAAEQQNMPVGALLRKWVQEKLMVDSAKEKSPDLIERIAVLEETVNYLCKRLPE